MTGVLPPTAKPKRGRDSLIYWDHFAREEWDREEKRDTAGDLARAKLRRVLRPVDVWASDWDLRTLAEQRADHCLDWVIEQPGVITFEAINAKLESLEARPMVQDCTKDIEPQIQAAIKRMGCPLYWRRQLRRAQVQKREAQEQAAGRIWARGMPYVHDVTAARHRERQAANRAMLEQTEIESADGETITLWQAAEASTANKSIRRGELMTRIRGCEEWATAAGMVGIFTTNTCPSRFHSSLFTGGKNPNFDGSTPKAGQSWLSQTWARARAKIHRQGLRVFGFRVAEPHHDGCPHWHMLLWVDPAQAEQLQELLRACWLQEDGDEYGAQEYRFKAEAIDPARGGAIAYVAKYISKNIDDCGSVGDGGHLDYQGQQKQLIDGGKAQRVAAWASAWGIRQFQAIGQPPVTVWRELRRVQAGEVVGASKRMQRAYAAVHKGEAHRADWRAYMAEQGGAMVGRGYQLRLAFDEVTTEGRYGPVDVKKPRGVFDVSRPGEECLSARKKWKPKGTWTPAERHSARVGLLAEVWADGAGEFCPPWTRLNNCTQHKPAKPASRVNSWAILAGDWPKPEPARTAGKT